MKGNAVNAENAMNFALLAFTRVHGALGVHFV